MSDVASTQMQTPVHVWRNALAAFGVCLAVFALLYWSTFQSMLQIWLESETFSHGLLVFPASVFLAWRTRNRLAGIQPRVSLPGLGLLVASLLVLFVARLGAVQVAEQFAFISAVIAIVWLTLGTNVVKRMAFPLLFLFFAVPFGEAAIPSLMEFTAWFTVAALKLTGIPVYQDGFMLSIPSGDFEVAKACSGIRYLIASFSLGTLFAYLTFTSLRRRLAFIAFSLALPILANGLRAYGIVMLAHLSDMRMAVGVDHLIYGWLFFGLVMFIAFAVGARFRQEPVTEPAAADVQAGQQTVGYPIAMVVVACLVMLLPTWYAGQVEHGLRSQTVQAPVLPRAQSPWMGPVEIRAPFVPDYVGYDHLAVAAYRNGASQIDVTLQTYSAADNELINALSSLTDGDRWQLLSNTTHEFDVGGQSYAVQRSSLRSSAQRRVVYSWYMIGARRAAGSLRAKVFETATRALGRSEPRVLVSVSTVVSDTEHEADALEKFITRHADVLTLCIVEPTAAACAAPQMAP